MIIVMMMIMMIMYKILLVAVTQFHPPQQWRDLPLNQKEDCLSEEENYQSEDSEDDVTCDTFWHCRDFLMVAST